MASRPSRDPCTALRSSNNPRRSCPAEAGIAISLKSSIRDVSAHFGEIVILTIDTHFFDAGVDESNAMLFVRDRDAFLADDQVSLAVQFVALESSFVH